MAHWRPSPLEGLEREEPALSTLWLTAGVGLLMARPPPGTLLGPTHVKSYFTDEEPRLRSLYNLLKFRQLEGGESAFESGVNSK